MRSPTENHKRHEARQAKARAMREKLLQEKAERLRLLTNKVNTRLPHCVITLCLLTNRVTIRAFLTVC